MIIAVTGASSRLGELLIGRLLEDDSITVRALINESKVRIEHSRLETHYWRELDAHHSLENCDVLFHLAFDRITLTNNIGLGETILRGINDFNIPKVILCSTVSVYGSRCHGVIEESKELVPDSEYARTKITVEKLFREALDPSGRLVIIRPSVILYDNNSSILRTANSIHNKNYFKLFLKRLLLKNRHTNYVSPYNVADALVFLMTKFDEVCHSAYNVTQDHDVANRYGELEVILYEAILHERPSVNVGITRGLLDYIMRILPIRGRNDYYYDSGRLLDEGFIFKRTLNNDLIEIARLVKDAT